MEINGWAVVRASYVWDEDLDDRLGDTFASIMQYVEVRPALAARTTGRRLNGTYVVQVAMQANRDRGQADDVIELFRHIGEVASGSYGQLHIFDDDRLYGDAKVMHVVVLARGQITRANDPFFTPFIPKVEAPDPEFGGDPDVVPGRFLPLGTVVALRGNDKKLMISGRLQKDTTNERVFDYVGCLYPEGSGAPGSTFLFNHTDIAWIHCLGFADAEEQAWADRLAAAGDG